MNQIGAQLRDARLARGMSVDDVASVTKIPRASVVAMEAGDHTALPAGIFVRGFIRAYAQTVGLDPSPMIRAIERAGNERQVVESARTRDARKARAATDADLIALHALNTNGRLGSTLRGGYLLLAVVAVGLLIAAWLSVGGETPTPNRLDNAARTPLVEPLREAVDGVSHVRDTATQHGGRP
jgi:cytoskeletal protein RodZ